MRTDIKIRVYLCTSVVKKLKLIILIGTLQVRSTAAEAYKCSKETNDAQENNFNNKVPNSISSLVFLL